jgi:protein-S-isoprenylcysteine O-methyltransferase Ste14
MSILDNKVPPPAVGLALAGAMWAVASVGPPLPLPQSLANVLAGALVVTGATFDVLGILAFRAARTTVDPLRIERASALVVHGIYRITRNPMYVGMACLLLAWACYLAAWLPFLGPPLFVAYITRFQIRPEERVLTRRFGAAFAEYAARVRRWL